MAIKWITRDGANIVDGVFSNKQFNGQQSLDENHPDVVAYFNPPPPTDDERIDRAFSQLDFARVIFEMFFQIINEIRQLQDTVNGTTNGPITKAQLKGLLKSKLP